MIKRKSILMVILMLFLCVIMFSGGMIFAALQSSNIVHADDASHTHEGYTAIRPYHYYYGILGSKTGDENYSSGVTKAGNYYIDTPSGNYEGYYALYAGWTVPTGTTKICLNGQKISLCKPIVIGAGATLIIEDDADKNGYIDCAKSHDKKPNYESRQSGSSVIVSPDDYYYCEGYSIIIKNGGKLIMNAGSIITNNVIHSMLGQEEEVNGVKVESGGTFEMNAGTIKEHTNYEVSSAGNFIMNGGVISGGKEYGVQIESGSCTIGGGTISGNRKGLLNKGTLTLNGGTITGNSEFGVDTSSGTCSVFGKVVVYENAFNNQGIPCNLIVKEDNKLNVLEGMQFGSKIGITLLDSDSNSVQGVFTTGGIAKNYKDYFFGDRFTAVKTEGNELKVTEDVFEYRGEKYIPFRSSNAKPSVAGNYYLREDLTLSGVWNIPSGTTKLYLNGHKLTGSGSTVISVKNSAELVIYDKREDDGIITTDYVGNSNIISVSNGGKVSFYNGIISGGTTGVNVTDGTFEMLYHDDETINEFDSQNIITFDAMSQIGGTITQNEYGIKSNNLSNMVFAGGRVSNNKVGGVYACGEISLCGNIIVAQNGTKGDFILSCYIDNSGTRVYQKIKVNQELDSNALVGITMEGKENEDCPGIFTQFEYPLSAQSYIQNFFSNSENCKIGAREGNLKLGFISSVNFDQTEQHGTAKMFVEGVEIDSAFSSDIVTIEVTNSDLLWQLKEVVVGYTRNGIRTIPGLVTAMGDAIFVSDSSKSLVCKINNNRFVLYNSDTVVTELTNVGLNTIYEGYYITDMCDGYTWAFKCDGNVIKNITIMFNGFVIYNSADGQESTGNISSDIKVNTITENYTYFFRMPTESVTVYLIYEQKPGVPYMTWNENEKKLLETELDEGYIVVNKSNPLLVTQIGDEAETPLKWIVFEGIINLQEITIKGTANIILKDNSILYIFAGIILEEGNTLNIFGQRDGSGSLTVGTYSSSPHGGIFSKENSFGTLNIYGGEINANSSSGYAAIGGGEGKSGGCVTIYGGEVIATGASNSVGIGAGNGGASNGTLTLVPEHYFALGNSYMMMEAPYTNRYQTIEVRASIKIEAVADDISILYNTEKPTLTYTATIDGKEILDSSLLSKISDRIILDVAYTKLSPVGSYEIVNTYNGYSGLIVHRNDYYKLSFTGGTLYVKYGDEGSAVYETEPTANENLIYSGEAQELIKSGQALGGEIQYRLGENGKFDAQIPTATNAGTYVVYYRIFADVNHSDSEIKSVEVTISKAEVEFPTVAESSSITYTGRAQNLVNLGLDDYGTVLYKLSDDEEYSLEIPTAVNVGEYIVYYTFVVDDNHIGVNAEGRVVVYIVSVDRTQLRGKYREATIYYNTILENYPTAAYELDIAIQNATNTINNQNALRGEIDYRLDELTKALDKAHANVVITKINDIGEVVYTSTCKNLIDDARKFYDILNEDELKYISSNVYNQLVDAETNYEAVDIVFKKIAAIGTVTYVGQTNPKILEARVAYDALTEKQKAIVPNYDTLLGAENVYTALKAANETKIITNTGYGVTVKTTGENVFPVDVELKITANKNISADETSTEYQAIQNLLAENEKIVKVYDIKLIDANGNEMQPTTTLSVHISVPTEVSTKNLRILHIHSESEIEFVNYTIEGNEILISVDNFSEFAFVNKTAFASDEVIAKIYAIGDVEYSVECKTKIDDARMSYDALTLEDKLLVTNYNVLVSAEYAYTSLTPTETPKSSTNTVGIVAIILSSLAILGMSGYLVFYLVSRKKKLFK